MAAAETLRATSLQMITRAAADEMNDFELVILVQDCVSPTVARDNVAVQFDGHAVSLHAERFHQRRKGGNRGVESLLFPIDVEFHDQYTNVRRVQCREEGVDTRCARSGRRRLPTLTLLFEE
jgi:hypothetical protein